MARERDEDMLEPILPKHPPYQRDDVPPLEGAAPAMPSAGRPSWDRVVLVGCAVVATLALVVVALRANSIAQDQRVQTCQVRAYAAQQAPLDGLGNNSRTAQERFGRELAKCVGLD